MELIGNSPLPLSWIWYAFERSKKYKEILGDPLPVIRLRNRLCIQTWNFRQWLVNLEQDYISADDIYTVIAVTRAFDTCFIFAINIFVDMHSDNRTWPTCDAVLEHQLAKKLKKKQGNNWNFKWIAEPIHKINIE